VFTLGYAITADTPTNTGGLVASYSVSPALPAGLLFNTSNGVISGTPTALVTAATYTVTATNAGGYTTATVCITVYGTDTKTQGNWQGAYGVAGENIVGSSAANYPAYAQVSVTGNTTNIWAASTKSVNALQQPGGSGRIAADWQSNTSFTINVSLTDGLSHEVSLYLLDYTNGRSESIEVLNAETGAVLSGPETVSSFPGGEYLTWALTGHVEFVITHISGPNAVVSGIFFDS
jgi:hypothetical protein